MFKCSRCDAQYSRKDRLSEHERKNHNITVKQEHNFDRLFCAVCQYTTSKVQLHKHYEQVHNIKITSTTHTFTNFTEFISWKGSKEADTKSKFIQQRACQMNKNSTKHHYYLCHRSGHYVPQGSNLRHLKTQGSKKINAFCPAEMKIIESQDGSCKLNFIETHIGHDNELGHLSLTSTERKEIASKIASKVPFDSILDDIRNSVSESSLHRRHLLTKKDLCNIEAAFNLTDDGRHHSNDATSVNCWVSQNTESVLYYKPQGTATELPLKDDDFVLVIMNEAQGEMLMKYGTEKVTVDGTHGMGNYGFQLITLMTIDDMNQGFPGAFLISNRSDETVLSLFFNCVKDKVGSLKTKIFMSDMEEGFYKAWVNVMGEPNKRLFCTWHVDQAWRKNLRRKVNSISKQAEVYKCLRVLLTEKDELTFQQLSENFVQLLFNDSDLQEFGIYFKDYYMTKSDYWAYCFRKKSGINTNMHIERMHRTLKHVYLKGKQIKRLDRALFAIMKLVRDRLFDRLIVLHKGKITNKLSDIRKRHKTSQSLQSELITENAEEWLVQSSSDVMEIYSVTKVRENDGCSCRLICLECNTCLHKYSCTCLDSEILGNMCKHIHLVCRFVAEKRENDVNKTASINENLVIHENPTTDESQIITKHLSKQNPVHNPDVTLHDLKEKLKKEMSDIIDSISSIEQIDMLRKLFSAARPNLNAIQQSETNFTPFSQNSEPANKKIKPQRLYQLKSTKKKSLKRKPVLSHPTQKEALETALMILNPSLHEEINQD